MILDLLELLNLRGTLLNPIISYWKTN